MNFEQIRKTRSYCRHDFDWTKQFVLASQFRIPFSLFDMQQQALVRQRQLTNCRVRIPHLNVVFNLQNKFPNQVGLL